MIEENRVRINKYLAMSGLASRRKCEEFIAEGRVTVNNKTVITPVFFILPGKDIVKVDGEKVNFKKKLYFILNKPKGFITSTSDEKHRPIVIDLINTNERIFPVGRLDYNTTGLLILTNDGELADFILHPKNKIIKEYVVTLNKDLDPEDEKKFIKGIKLDRINSKFLSIDYPDKNRNNKVVVTTNEGRNHFVKRMFLSKGYFVDKLHRSKIGNLELFDLAIGKYYKVSLNDILYNLTNKLEKDFEV